LPQAAVAGGQNVVQEDVIPVVLDGLPLSFDVPPLIIEGRTFVPFRAIAEALQVEVAWHEERQEVLAVGKGIEARLRIGSQRAYINGHPEALDAPPVIIDNRTLIPLRFFSEAFGCKVEWLGHEAGVRIFSPPAEMTVIGFYALGSGSASSWTNLFGVEYPSTGVGHTDLVRELALGWYSLDEEGNLLTRSRTGWQRPSGWEKVLDAAQKYDLKTEMVIHEADSEGIITSFLANREAVQRAVQLIAAEAVLYDGVNLNLEGLGLTGTDEELKQLQENLNYFCRLLSLKLREAGKSLTLTLHPLNSSYRAYDYKALGEIADRIIVMAHDYGQRPEPLQLVEEAVKLARAKVSAEKLVLAISIPSENTESVLAKVSLAKRYGLEGISLWRLGIISEEIWEALKTAIQVK